MRRAIGVFVGGKSARMGRPKGLLPAPGTGEPLVVRAVGLGRALGVPTVLVGDAAPYRALDLGVPVLHDDPPGIGPVGGLCALLGYADVALALACDMPFVAVEDLRALFEVSSIAAVLAARGSDDGPWEPLLARYDAAQVLPAARASIAAGERGFQRVFQRVSIERFVPCSPRATEDWDEPGDLQR
jgi:molybdopterin-guanine dinucleotide biosynthesis protein A